MKVNGRHAVTPSSGSVVGEVHGGRDLQPLGLKG